MTKDVTGSVIFVTFREGRSATKTLTPLASVMKTPGEQIELKKAVVPGSTYEVSLMSWKFRLLPWCVMRTLDQP